MVTVRVNGQAVEEIPSGVMSDGTQFSTERKVELAAWLRDFKPVASHSIHESDNPQSAAKKRLEKLKAQRKPAILPFEYEGETFYIKRLSYQNLIDLALSISRDGHNVLNIHDESGVLAVTTAVLVACVCNADESAYFEHEDIEEYLNTPDDAALVSALFMACNEANPDILSTLKKT